jgi:hypothetical protein
VIDRKDASPNITGNINTINFSVDDFKRIRERGFLYVDKTKRFGFFSNREAGLGRNHEIFA